MPTRRVHHLAAATAAATTALTTVLTAVGAAPARAAGELHLVRPGESIQQAVDAALPGDTVQLLPGEYRGSVRITTPGLTLRGAGRDSVLLPADASLPVPAADGAALCATSAPTSVRSPASPSRRSPSPASARTASAPPAPPG
ncbi:hypothetical protein [Streptomyces sp. NRRL S-495]|uniref:hypothetical protein n=1 Tax=Streptomyces sp. NRRL S-495 TaxID=1609133 RepID=UPI000A7F2595